MKSGRYETVRALELTLRDSTMYRVIVSCRRMKPRDWFWTQPITHKFDNAERSVIQLCHPFSFQYFYPPLISFALTSNNPLSCCDWWIWWHFRRDIHLLIIYRCGFCDRATRYYFLRKNLDYTRQSKGIYLHRLFYIYTSYRW